MDKAYDAVFATDHDSPSPLKADSGMSEAKRKHTGKQGGARKRFKADGTKISSTTIHGPGIFVTCVKGKERFAGRDLRDVLEPIADKLWPTERPLETTTDAPPDDDEDDDDEDDDIEAMISKERAKIHEEHAESTELTGERYKRSNKPKRRIVIHHTDTPCVLFVGCEPPIDPVRLTLSYLDQIKQTGSAQTRSVQRLEPIYDTCIAALPELLILGEKIFKEKLGGVDADAKPQVSYKILSRIRNCTKLTSAKIIEELPRKVPPSHRVSLTNPDIVILVIAYKSVAGIGIAPRFEELKKYNVSQLVDVPDLDLDQGGRSRSRVTNAVVAQSTSDASFGGND